MHLEKKIMKWGVLSIIVILAIAVSYVPAARAQNWSVMPPYNLLWPLWSPILSPLNALTGLPTPLISSLTKNTLLPVQPALAWDPSRLYPWLFYNVPSILGGGLNYFDPYYGMNTWPPASYLDSLTGLPVGLTPPLGYSLLAPTDISAFGPFVNTANLSYLALYPTTQFGTPFTSLLTAAQIWGLPAI
jgi:hypothetical protein